jgi:hypothetical protein
MIEQSNLSSYLNCPFCPAQAYMTRGGLLFARDSRFTKGLSLRKYVCPAKHEFLVEDVLPMAMQEEYADSLL